jgi:hypothetical protein
MFKNKPKFFEKMGVNLENIISEFKNYAIKNPKKISGSAGLIGATLMTGLLNIDPTKSFNAWTLALSIPFGAAISQVTYLFPSQIKKVIDLGYDVKNIKTIIETKQEIKEEELRGIDKLVNYISCKPHIIAGITGLLGTYKTLESVARYGFEKLGENILNQPLKGLLALGVIATPTALTYGLGYLLGKFGGILIKPKNKHFMKEWRRLKLARLYMGKEKLREEYVKAAERHNSYYFTLKYAILCEQTGEKDEAFRTLMTMFEKEGPDKIPMDFSKMSFMEVIDTINSYTKKIRAQPDLFSSYAILAWINDVFGETKKTDQVIEKFLFETQKRPETRLNGKIFNIVMQEKIKNYDSFDTQLIDLIVNHGDALVSIGGSGMYHFPDNSFSGSALGVRMSSNLEVLEKEIESTIKRREVLDKIPGNNKYKIMTVPRIILPEGSETYFMGTIFELGETLKKYLLRTKDFEIHHKAGEFLGLMAANDTQGLPVSDQVYEEEFQKGMNRSPSERLIYAKSLFEEATPELVKGFGRFSQVTAYDFRDINLIVNLFLTMIDMQEKGLTNPFYDPAKLNYIGNRIPRTEKGEIIRLETSKRFNSNVKIGLPQDEFLHYERKAGILKTVSHSFFHHKNPYEKTDVIESLQNTLWLVQKLRKDAEMSEKQLNNIEQGTQIFLQTMRVYN